MSDDDSDLSPSVVEMLRDLPPVDEATRERHLAAALAELNFSRPRTAGRLSVRWLGTAAASIALIAAGYGLSSLASSDSRAGLAIEGVDGTLVSDSTLIVKGGAGAGSSSAQAVESPCDSTIDLPAVHRYQVPIGWRVAYVRTDPTPAIVVVDESTCSVLQEIDLP